MDDTRYPDWKQHSPKEEQLEAALLRRSKGKAHKLLEELIKDREVFLYHSYANAVSVRRLGYNDHGPVHARITSYNSLKVLDYLREGGVKTSLESEGIGTYEDSVVATVLGCFLHDVGMAVTRDKHEWHSLSLSDRMIIRYVEDLYPDDLAKQAVVRSMAHEVIVGHMAHTRVHSIEAGTVMIADGTDMARGRSRIPLNLGRDPSVGDMHRYSANSVSKVEIGKGSLKPVKISVFMDDVTGLFQVEEVLMTKVKASPIMSYLEIVALVDGQEPKYYLR